MVTTWTSRYNRPISQEEQHLYDHFLFWIELETPDQLIERFRVLFIEGFGYPDASVTAALDKVTSSRLAEEDFHYVLNRCCHILINRWQSRSQFQMAIPQLVALFDNVPEPPIAGILRARSVRRLRELVKLFQETEQYLKICRLSKVLAANAEAGAEDRPLGTLINRYPYLYDYCLLSEDSTQEQQQTVRRIQARLQRQFEIDLSQYMTYQVRQSYARQMDSSSGERPRLIQPVSNPTLLSDRQLDQAIRHYVGKVQGGQSYRDLACTFITQSGHGQSFGAFKDDLYEYITSSVDPEYGKCQFNNQLYGHLQSTLPQNNGRKLDDFLIVRTCNNLLNFLVIDSPQRPQHFVFVDLINNLGPTLTTGLLLKVVLLCRTIRPALEKRFSILFNHYEFYSREAVQWLVMVLENLQVALSTHFGNLDLSFVH